ncbi:hypothetical protein K438DRAFT_1804027 [Mycena galopus ATCC 62051]|nr:hypothetical protein K438DRAFT_1804027 [Mycena galopus ATCC 62051]
MFHHSYPSVLSYQTPVSQPNPREKYLAALAEAKAAEAEYLAAEQLQQEENQLRERLEQIHRLKHQPSAGAPGPHSARPRPSVRFVASGDALRPHHGHQAAYPEFGNSMELPLVGRPDRRHHHRHAHDCCSERGHSSSQEPRTSRLEIVDLLNQLFDGRAEARQEPAKTEVPAPAAAEAVNLEQLLQHPEAKPAKETAPHRQAEAPITLDQLIGHFLGGGGVETEPSRPSTSSTSTPQGTLLREEASSPTPAPSPAAKPAPTLTPAAQPHFLGAAGRNAASNQAGAPPAAAQPQAGPSKSTSTSTKTNDSPAVNKTEREEREERELQEAIRMSLADSQPSSTTSESKGKSPAPAPVKDVASSSAEVHAIDASFIALSNEFVFPPQLDFTTSAPPEESVMAKLSYSAQNQPVRFYHQALSGLLARLDAVESFGDEGLRHERKEVVGRVEGAMDEVESVVEGKWRQWAGRERTVESAPSSPTTEEKEEQDAPVLVAAEDVNAPDAVEVADSHPGVLPSRNEPLSAAESVATLRPSSPAPSDTDATPASPAPSTIDTFLLPASAAAPVIQKKPRASESDAGSDWSEVDA